MTRATTGILLLLAVLAVTLGAYFIVFPGLGKVNLQEAEKGLVSTGRLLQQMDVSDEGRLVWKMSQLAERASLHNLLRDRPSSSGSTEAWLNKLRAEVAGLATAVRKVAPVQDFFILDSKGIGLVRNIDLHWTGKAPSKDPIVQAAVQKAIQGERRALVNNGKDGTCRTISVPVRFDGRVQAVLLATFPLDDALAKARSGEFGMQTDFAYVKKDKIVAAALSPEARTAVEKYMASDAKPLDDLLDGKQKEPSTISTGADNWMIAGFPLLVGNKGDDSCAIIVVRNIESLRKPFSDVTLWLFALGGATLFLGLFVVFFLGGRITRGIEQLEKDALEIVNVDERHRFKVSGPTAVKALAELLNQVRGIDTGQETDWKPLTEEGAEEAAADEGAEEAAADEGAEETAADEGAEETAAEEGAEETAAGEDAEETAAEEGAEEATAGEDAEEATAGEDAEEAAADEGAEEATAEEDAMEDSAEEDAMEAAAEEGAEEAAAEEDAMEAAEEATADEGKDEVSAEVAAEESDAGGEVRESADGDEAEKPDAEAPTRGDEGKKSSAATEHVQLHKAQAPARQEDEDDLEQYREVYEDFVTAKESIGEKVEHLDLERFASKLKKQEQKLISKHDCRAVRFQVKVKDSKVSLRPRIIK